MSKEIRMEMEFDDGLVVTWTGEELEKWLKVVNGVLQLHQVRTGVNLDIPAPTKAVRKEKSGE